MTGYSGTQIFEGLTVVVNGRRHTNFATVAVSAAGLDISFIIARKRHHIVVPNIALVESLAKAIATAATWARRLNRLRMWR